MGLFSDEEEARISAAITAAERNTSGEIVAVVADSSENYLYVPFMWAALGALLVPWPFIHFTWISVQIIYLIQLVVFLLLILLIWPKPARVRLVPRGIRNAHVRRRATEQFLAQNMHTTQTRTGILIFVSLVERHAEVLADSAIHAKVADGTWQDIVDQLTLEISQGRPADAFVHAIEAAGRHLAQHFPPGSDDPNELPDHLIVLEG